MTIAGYPTRGNPILGLVVTNDASGAPMDEPMTDAFGLPFTTLTYANGAGHVAASGTQKAGPKTFGHRMAEARPHPDGRSDLSGVDTTAPSYLQESAVPMGSETHGGEDVAIYARGPGAERVGGVVEQSVIYYALEAALRDRLDPPPAE
jgi:alkaline phosphatase